MFLDCAGLTIRVQQAGAPQAPCLLMLHSIGTTLHVWDMQADSLAACGFRVVRMDLRGHGMTSVPQGPYSIGGMAQDAMAVMDALGAARFHLAGLSIGGLIAQAMAIRAPQRVGSLILCDTARAIPPPEMWRQRAAAVRSGGLAAIADGVLARWLTPARQASAQAGALRGMLLATQPEGYAGAAEAIAALEQTDEIRTIASPTLVLVGDQDLATPLALAEALVSAIPGAQLRVVRDAAHIAPMEQPALVTAEILAFLRRGAAGTPDD